MKTLLTVIVALALAVGAGVMTHKEPGYVFVGFGEWSIETTLVVLLVGLIALFLLAYASLRMLGATLRVPQKVRAGSLRRRNNRARRLFNKALIELSEGRWYRAETLLAHPLVASDQPLMAALLAALSAQQQRAEERRDQYLRDAVEAVPGAETAICLVQAELQLNHHQFEESLANLTRLREIAPRQDRVPRMLAKVLRQLGDWPALADLMPEIRKRKLIDETDVARYELMAWTGILDPDGSQQADTLQKNWQRLPRQAREHAEMIRRYSAALRRLGAHEPAEAAVRAAIDRHWDDALVVEYGLISAADPARQLIHAERWKKRHENNAGMLLTLGRLSLRRQLWGQARAYLENSVAQQANADSLLELGRLLERLGETDAACERYRQALAIELDDEATLPPPVRRDGGESASAMETRERAGAEERSMTAQPIAH